MLSLRAALAAQAALGSDRWSLHALEDDAHQRMISLFRDALNSATVITLGRPEVKDHFFKRVLHLIKDPDGRCFIPNLSVTFADQPIGSPMGRG